MAPSDPNEDDNHGIEAALANMQPLRDLAKNWDIDIASFLEDHLQDIVGHLDNDDNEMETNNQEDEEAPPNFAQAALLLQNSSHVYSRKVEYLYSLVYAALEDLASSTIGGATKRSRTTAADASIDEFHAFDPDMQFLLLDDVLPTDQTQAGDKINLGDDHEHDDDDALDRTNFSSITRQSTRTRLSLGGMSVSQLDNRSSYHGSQQGVPSSANNNFMGSLGDSQGGNLRLVNGNCDVGDHGMLIMPGTTHRGSSSDSNSNQTDGNGATNVETATTAAANYSADDGDDVMMLHDDHDNDGVGFDLAPDDDDNAPGAQDFEAATHPPTKQAAIAEKKNADPWALLDPHDVGTTKSKPLRIGITYRLPEGLTEPPSQSVTGSHTRRRTVATRKSSVDRPAAAPPVVSIATETFRATVANRRHAAAISTSFDLSNAGGGTGSMNESNSSTMYQTVVAPPKIPLNGLAFGDEFAYIAKANEKRKAAERRARRKLLVQEPEQAVEQEEADNLFGFDDYDDASVDDGGVGNVDDGDGAVGNTGIASLDDAYASPDARDTSNLDAVEFEALCRAHIKAFAKGAEKYATETNLTKRVGDWQSKLAPILEEEERRPEFNIHDYGDRVIELMQDEIEANDGSTDVDPKKANVVNFKDVTRDCEEYEVCRLFLASLNLTSAGNVSFTSNSMDSLDVKLLNARVERPMETYMAPSAAP